MSSIERADDLIIMVPTCIPDDALHQTKQEATIDRDLRYAQLELMCGTLFREPRCFVVNDKDKSTQSTVLTVPTGLQQTSTRELFVAVNSETPSLKGDGSKELTLQAFRWIVQTKRIAQLEATVAEGSLHCETWKDKAPGPFIGIDRKDKFVTVDNWRREQLEVISPQGVGSLTSEGLKELRIVEKLIGVIAPLSTDNEINGINLFCEEL